LTTPKISQSLIRNFSVFYTQLRIATVAFFVLPRRLAQKWVKTF